MRTRRNKRAPFCIFMAERVVSVIRIFTRVHGVKVVFSSNIFHSLFTTVEFHCDE